MIQKYQPPQRKEVKITSLAIEKDIRVWIDENIPSRARSDFFNTLAREYIEQAKKRGKTPTPKGN